ncbi:MAG: DUF4129 domain-containing protein [Actinomycetota bacterium]|nr:DUF4129 domain-containing protein [Actinomycetota bacterium]
MNPDATPEELRDEAAEILSRPEFAAPERSFVDRVLGWIGDRINDLFTGLGGGDVGSVLLLLLVIAAVAGLVLMIQRRTAPMVSERTPRTASTSVSRQSRATEWRERADAARAAGAWAEAVRCEHRHLAAVLDDRAYLRERDHRTAHELVDDVRSEPLVSGGLDDVTTSFEDVWYGSELADERLADAVRAVSEDLKARTAVRR